MSWSYHDPSASAKDAVRFLIGDTDSKDPLLLDGEVTYLLNQANQSVLAASIRGCEQIAMKFARLADEAVGQVRISYNQKYQSYLKMKDTLRARIAIEDMTPYAGGISVTDKNTQKSNQDRVQPDFTKHVMEAPSIAPSTRPEFDNIGIATPGEN